MGKPTTKGFKKEVKISSVHNQGENTRKADEALREIQLEARDRPELEHMLVYELKPRIETIIRKVFVKFCQGHKLEEYKIEEEWKNFRKILRRHL